MPEADSGCFAAIVPHRGRLWYPAFIFCV